MTDNNKKIREPLVHITKRDDMVWWRAYLVRGAGILLALIVCSLVIVALTGYNPIQVYSAMIKGSFGSKRKFWSWLQNSAILLGISLAITPAFKMRFWNTGAEGQVLISCLACSACMFYIGEALPSWLLLVIMLVAGVTAGIVWAGIPAVFKAKWNTNETLFTLMMNYVATQMVSLSIMSWVKNGSMVLPMLNSNTHCGWLPDLFGQEYVLTVIIVAIITVIMSIYLKHSKQGYEISVVGESENTARYIGINVKKVIIRTVAISGALCGVIGWLLIAGANHTVNTNTVGGNGFTAIMVSWMAKFSPPAMAGVSLLICFLGKGAEQIATAFRLNQSVSDIITGIIILFIIGSEFFVRYKVNFRSAKNHSSVNN